MVQAARAPVLMLLASLVAPASAGTPPPELTASVEIATAGFYRLVWEGGQGATPVYVLQESRDPGFEAPRTVYRGTNQASVMSGREDGIYYYRVRVGYPGGRTGDWSAPAKVTVDHHPLARAITFFAVGGVVFVATVGLIVAGSRRARRESGREGSGRG
ncbi:MAG: hypothetical protein GWO02_09760 [Gammaproteobacteria bacterium]|nr:hypothetical protein [Gammaproteobacteria bacterium]